ncbi:MAG: class I SAM-dependent methyltransferase [Desulfamplus sp.]|nr:class I SAM-dependent methyltransferase [Desulfamplus sp.]
MMDIKKITQRACPLCGYDVLNELKLINCLLFDDSPVSQNIRIVSCKLCGFVFYDTSSGMREWDEFYEKHYFIRFYKYRESNHMQKELLYGFAKFLENSNLSSDSFIIDVGCGPGHFLTILKSLGYSNLAGIDVCSDFVEELSKRAISFFIGRAEKLPFPDLSVDCIIFSHIIEHLVNPNAALKEMCRCIKKDGFILIEQPDLTRYDEIIDMIPLNHFIFEHINHFDQFHIESFFLQGGFRLHSKELLIKDNTPSMRILFKKTGSTPNLISTKNFDSYKKIMGWLQSNDKFKYPEAEELINKGYKLYLWGLSYQSLMHFSQSNLSNKRIEGFFDIDPRKQLKTIRGKPICSPKMISKLSNTDIVLIGVGPSSKIMEETLINEGFRGRYFLL